MVVLDTTRKLTCRREARLTRDTHLFATMALATAQITTAWSTNAKTARGVRMEERVIANPLDADAWVVLLAEAAEQKAADYRPLFERCVTHFPSAACVWYLDSRAACRPVPGLRGQTVSVGLRL